MLAGRIITNVQAAARHDRSETGERAFPVRGLYAGALHGSLDAPGFLAPGARIDADGSAGRRQQPKQFFFEGVRKALGGVIAHSQTYRKTARVARWGLESHVRLHSGHS